MILICMRGQEHSTSRLGIAIEAERIEGVEFSTMGGGSRSVEKLSIVSFRINR